MSEIQDLSVIYINRQMKPEEFNHIVLPLRRGLRDYLQRLTSRLLLHCAKSRELIVVSYQTGGL